MAKLLRLPNINNIMISGRLTRDLELKYTPSGTPVAKISIANDRKYKDKNGEWQSDTSFVDVSLFGETAERLANNLVKGIAVLVEGRLRVYSYSSQDGVQKKGVEIVSSRVHILEKEGEYEDNSENKNNNSENKPEEEFKNVEGNEDNLPFRNSNYKL